MTERTVTVTDARPVRLDALVRTALPILSRRVVWQVIADGAVRVNGRRAAKGTMVRPGDHVTLPNLTGLSPEPDLPVHVVHEDDALVALEKPGGMPAHALDPRQRGTVAAFLLARYPAMAGVGTVLAPGLVHRLDTGTSGLLLAARTSGAYAAVRAALGAQQVEKRYLAVVAGAARLAGVRQVRIALAHDPRAPHRMVPAPPGVRAWAAESMIEALAAGEEHSLVAVTIRTGVTHQVRAHLAVLGHPVLGDAVYGALHPGLPPGRHALHAAGLRLAHPVDGRRLELDSPLPPDLQRLVP